MSQLISKTCQPYDDSLPSLSKADIAAFKKQLNPAWVVDEAGQVLERKFTFKAFAKAVYTANLAAYISDSERHHADVAFGWGYCNITYTSHELARLTENDFICAAKLDAAIG